MKNLIITVLFVAASIPAAGRTIEFSGLRWEVRGWGGAPGNGCWSDGEESVRVDDDGNLHLVIRKVAGVWCQAEVRALDFAEWGDHTFYVTSRLDQLDPDVVLGMFLYDPDAELDIEVTGSFASPEQRGWFTIFGRGGRLVAQKSFPLQLSGAFSTHRILWLPDRVGFRSWHGHCDNPPCGGWIQRWTYSGPSTPGPYRAMQPRINLWIHNGGSIRQSQEVIVSAYEFFPPAQRRRSVRRP